MAEEVGAEAAGSGVGLIFILIAIAILPLAWTIMGFGMLWIMFGGWIQQHICPAILPNQSSVGLMPYQATLSSLFFLLIGAFPEILFGIIAWIVSLKLRGSGMKAVAIILGGVWIIVGLSIANLSRDVFTTGLSTTLRIVSYCFLGGTPP